MKIPQCINFYSGLSKADEEDINHGSGVVGPTLLRDVEEEAVGDVEVEPIDDVANNEVGEDIVEMKFVHNKERPVSCQEPGCEKKIRHQEISNHLRSIHGAVRLVCKQKNCKATFLFPNIYYIHMKKGH